MESLNWSSALEPVAFRAKKIKSSGFYQASQDASVWANAHEWGQSTRARFKKLQVIGFGGSSLGSRTLVQSLAADKDSVQFWDELDPDKVVAQFGQLSDLDVSHWLIVSKSGRTMEVFYLLSLVLDLLGERGVDTKDRVTIVTESNDSPLRQFAESKDFQIIDHPSEVGGRYSVFSFSGLLPAAFAGLDLGLMRQGVDAAGENEKLVGDLAEFLLSSIKRGDSQLGLWNYSSRLNEWQEWFQQLYAESLGKAESLVGEVAPALPPLTNYSGLKHHHSVLQQVADGTHGRSILAMQCIPSNEDIKIKGSYFSQLQGLKGKSLNDLFCAHSRAAISSLEEKSIPIFAWQLRKLNERVVGELLQACMLSIVYCAEVLNINAFDQPGVERCKQIARKDLGL